MGYHHTLPCGCAVRVEPVQKPEPKYILRWKDWGGVFVETSPMSATAAIEFHRKLLSERNITGTFIPVAA